MTKAFFFCEKLTFVIMNKQKKLCIFNCIFNIGVRETDKFKGVCLCLPQGRAKRILTNALRAQVLCKNSVKIYYSYYYYYYSPPTIE